MDRTNRKRRPRISLVAVLIVAGVLLWQAAAGAQAGSPLAAEVGLNPETAAMWDALKAEYPEVSFDQATETFAFQERYSIFATELEQRFPETFAGAWIDHGDGGKLVIAMTNTGVAEDAVPIGLRGRVRLTEVEHPLQQLQELSRTLNGHIDPNFGEASPDLKENGVWIEILETQMEAIRRDPGLQSAVAATVGQGVPVTYQILDGIPVNDGCTSPSSCNPLPAGAAINGAATCTSGFKMKRGSTLGMLTAKHCAAGLYTHGFFAVLTSNGGAESSVSDVRFLATTGNLTIADDVYSFGTLKDMSAYANPVLDQTLCRGGRNSSDCGIVANVSVSDFRFRINNMASCGGDSGGPVYVGSTAYGTHQSSTAGTCPGPSNETSYAVKITSAITFMFLTFQSS